jgi:hypothetical protein
MRQLRLEINCPSRAQVTDELHKKSSPKLSTMEYDGGVWTVYEFVEEHYFRLKSNVETAIQFQSCESFLNLTSPVKCS